MCSYQILFLLIDLLAKFVLIVKMLLEIISDRSLLLEWIQLLPNEYYLPGFVLTLRNGWCLLRKLAHSPWRIGQLISIGQNLD